MFGLFRKKPQDYSYEFVSAPFFDHRLRVYNGRGETVAEAYCPRHIGGWEYHGRQFRDKGAMLSHLQDKFPGHWQEVTRV